MSANKATPVEPIIDVVRGELSSKRRWVYRFLMLVNGGFVAALLSLWGTEPGPLPMQLHIAFAGLSVVACGWIGVLGWVLIRRDCPTASDRIATTWMAFVASCTFLVLSVSIAWMRQGWLASAGLFLIGSVMVVFALFLVRQAYAKREELLDALSRLETPDIPG